MPKSFRVAVSAVQQPGGSQPDLCQIWAPSGSRLASGLVNSCPQSELSVIHLSMASVSSASSSSPE